MINFEESGLLNGYFFFSSGKVEYFKDAGGKNINFSDDELLPPGLRRWLEDEFSSLLSDSKQNVNILKKYSPEMTMARFTVYGYAHGEAYGSLSITFYEAFGRVGLEVFRPYRWSDDQGWKRER